MSTKKVRVRFAPSPTGPLHIGGVRTALYNYLWAKKHGGNFLLRIEDTDRTRLVEGAESYILRSLEWLGLTPDESPWHGGKYGPYRQSDRKDIYRQYVDQLIEAGKAYYAFDTPNDLERAREKSKDLGRDHFKYDARSRIEMKNSLTLSDSEIKRHFSSGENVVVRMKVDPGDEVVFTDRIRGEVRFATDELDDKVILKSDGMPTYHMANVVDDFLMEISDVIRGEEWLSSTAHHILLYGSLGWQDNRPSFAHLPLILKPKGKGKLSKRDGQKLGIPVFPLNWEDGKEPLAGFREKGFSPEALINFLVFLGWNPGTEQEIFSLEELISAFDIKAISKSGAKFDFEKAQWFNQQYILNQSDDEFLEALLPYLPQSYTQKYPKEDLDRILLLFKDRIKSYEEFVVQAKYMFEQIRTVPEKLVRKRYNPEYNSAYQSCIERLEALEDFEAYRIKKTIDDWSKDHGIGLGKILPLLRLAATGESGGPDIFIIMELLGRQKTLLRVNTSLENFKNLIFQ